MENNHAPQGFKESAFFSRLVSQLGNYPNLSIVAVAHMVSNTVLFAPALARLASLDAILPKPKSVGMPEYEKILELSKTLDFEVHDLSRDWAGDSELVADFLRRIVPEKNRIVLVDIGGYFSESVQKINELLGGRIAGVMEGTENGAQKYESTGLIHEVPIATVARSDLKLPEDYLVGASIVFSVEAVLRENSQILQTKTACIIGFGKVGSAVAESMRGRGVPTCIYDTNAIAMAQAAARGFRVYSRIEDALLQSTIVISATGQNALTREVVMELSPGTFVATVTSSDDEFGTPDPLLAYTSIRESKNLVRYFDSENPDEYFYLVNDGNPANFIHGAVIGPAMQLIEGEKLAAVASLAKGEFGDCSKGHLHTVDPKIQELVARTWSEYFI